MQCKQCDRYFEFKEMADETTCQECEKELREFQMVDLKQLLETMKLEDIYAVVDEVEED